MLVDDRTRPAGALAPGLLLAAPALGDPNFHRSVVLLGFHDEEGAVGWVLNGRPLAPTFELLHAAELVPAGTRLPAAGSYAGAARVGGPVMPGSAWLLFAGEPAFGGYPAEPLDGGWAMTGAREAIEAVARGAGPARFRLYLGYAGWGPGQLEREIRAGAWLPVPFRPHLLDGDVESLWDAAYVDGVGAPPVAFTTTGRGEA